MNLKILLPFQVFAKKTGVLRVVADTHQGSFGIFREVDRHENTSDELHDDPPIKMKTE